MSGCLETFSIATMGSDKSYLAFKLVQIEARAPTEQNRLFGQTVKEKITVKFRMKMRPNIPSMPVILAREISYFFKRCSWYTYLLAWKNRLQTMQM